MRAVFMRCRSLRRNSIAVEQDIENLLTDVIVLRKDAPVYAASLEEISSRYSFGIQNNEEGVLYAEACAEGYHVVTHKQENTLQY